MKNVAIDRTVGKIVITSDSERVPTTKKRYVSALLVVHLLNRLPCPLCLFRQGVSAVRLPSVTFSSSIFRRSTSICPRLRCSAGAPDENEVLVRTGAVTD